MSGRVHTIYQSSNKNHKAGPFLEVNLFLIFQVIPVSDSVMVLGSIPSVLPFILFVFLKQLCLLIVSKNTDEHLGGDHKINLCVPSPVRLPKSACKQCRQFTHLLLSFYCCQCRAVRCTSRCYCGESFKTVICCSRPGRQQDRYSETWRG